MKMPGYISELNKALSLPAQERKLVVLGSTGSIGCSVLKVIQEAKDNFSVLGLACWQRIDLLAKQANRWRPKVLGIGDAGLVGSLQELLAKDYSPLIVVGQKGFQELAVLAEADMVVSAQVGAAGLSSTFAAVKAGKVVALANKESLVLAGDLIRETCKETGAVILPVDSEHNALFQAIMGQNLAEVEKLILTASGGPFWNWDKEEMQHVTPQQALAHPNWSMGAKISIDSATMMNKGLELIEAVQLYGFEPAAIDVLIHPQSIVHSLVQYCDGSVLAQLSVPDMCLPIAFCLSFPERLPLNFPRLDLTSMSGLDFFPPDHERFPMLSLAYNALKKGPSCPIVLNAANEIAVDAFLQGRISFLDIFRVNRKMVDEHQAVDIKQLSDVFAVDQRARQTASHLLESL